MEKFQYLTSEDHAKWYVINPWAGVKISAENLECEPGRRVEMRRWIEKNCRGTVYAWNETRTPARGEANWGSMVMPQGNMVIHFEDEKDKVLFSLTWT